MPSLLEDHLNSSGQWIFRFRGQIPVAVYLIGIPVLISNSETGSHGWPWLALCMVVGIFGLLVRCAVVAFAPVGTSGRNTKGHVAEVLNTTGLYSLLRNPLYFGNFFLGLSLVMFTQSFWFIVSYSLLFALYHERIIVSEERFLINKFGHVYEDWVARVPAFWPNWRNYTPPETRFTTLKVYKSEHWTLLAWLILLTLYKGIADYQSQGEVVFQPFLAMLVVLSFVASVVARLLRSYTSAFNFKEG